MPNSNPKTLSFLIPKIWVKFQWDHHNRGAKYTPDVGIAITISLKLENETRDGFGYYETLIGSHMRFI